MSPAQFGVCDDNAGCPLRMLSRVKISVTSLVALLCCITFQKMYCREPFTALKHAILSKNHFGGARGLA